MRAKIIFIFILFSALALTAKEGMFRLDGITAGLAADMKAMGCQFDPTDIWKPGTKCLAMAVVNLGGGSGSFVSPDGLIITNHHVAFGAVQSLSSPQHNYIRDGFLASERSEEIPAPGYNVRVMSSFENVSFRFRSALRPRLNPQKRLRLIEKISQELIRDGEKIPGNECTVARFYSGREFYLVTYFKIRDMRVVYVPARSIGPGVKSNYILFGLELQPILPAAASKIANSFRLCYGLFVGPGSMSGPAGRIYSLGLKKYLFCVKKDYSGGS